MTGSVGRRVAAIGLAAMFIETAALAQTPPTSRPAGGFPPVLSEPKPLANELAGPRLRPDSSASGERVRLVIQLQELIRRMNERPAGSGLDRPAGKTPITTITPPRPKFDFPDTGKVVDGLKTAMNLFRDNDYDSAYRAFQRIDRSQLSSEDRSFVQYMSACCLRRMNRRSESAALFREVAESKDDPFLVESALWQLSLIRTSQELETQLEQLRSRPKSR